MNRGILIYKDIGDVNLCYIRQPDKKLAGLSLDFVKGLTEALARTCFSLATQGDRYSYTTDVPPENLKPYLMITEEGGIYVL